MKYQTVREEKPYEETEEERAASEELKRLLMALRINPSLARGSSAVMNEIEELCQSFKKKDEELNKDKKSKDATTEEEEGKTKKSANKLTKRDED